MIEIKPNIKYESTCPYTGTKLIPQKIIWQGMHICAVSESAEGTTIIEDLPVGHALYSPWQLDLQKELLFGSELGKDWLGKSVLKSLQAPIPEEISITKEVFKSCQKVIVLNCIDYLYGHCLLKLLNAERHLQEHPELGLVVIIPKFLRWMVPDGVAEIWSVGISLKKSRDYYLILEQFVQHEFERFTEIYLSEAFSHPRNFDITKFTQIPTHSFAAEDYKITFVWRQDRLWSGKMSQKVVSKLNLNPLGLERQNQKIVELFGEIKEKLPKAKFAVAGLGKQTTFPDWIQDFRVERYDENTEKLACKLYSESRLIIGVHGSNMLLPSAHAGMTIDLIPEGRWLNFAQDIIYQESDPRMASYRYRYLPIKTSISEIADMGATMIERYHRYRYMMADFCD